MNNRYFKSDAFKTEYYELDSGLYAYLHNGVYYIRISVTKELPSYWQEITEDEFNGKLADIGLTQATVVIPSVLEMVSGLYKQQEAILTLQIEPLTGLRIDTEQKAEAMAVLGESLSLPEPEQKATWKAGEWVTAGIVRSHGGKQYTCLQAHVTQAGWEPPNVPALWSEVKEEFAPWKQPLGAHDAYPAGAKVMHKGKTWLNTHGNGNIWEPGVYGWTEWIG